MEELSIRRLLPEDVSERYLSWLRDEEVTQFLEMRWSSYTLEELKDYIHKLSKSQTDFLMGIFVSGVHIGNVKIGSIHPIHRNADIGIIIGEKSFRGKGIGTKVIMMATEFAFKELNINHLLAGAYSQNEASIRAFQKAGYSIAGRLKNRAFYKGFYTDVVLMEKIKS
ncbi:MAG: GNAT family N-acetyltransferase [Aquificaceae bacterium]|nr:GNAT family N-acetyltransferase [Aquificaceae bacterium]MDW8237529.1 GNAT family protein [Aquificaceae bacterium]